MSNIAIRAEGIGKRYRLGLTHDRAIRDLLGRWTEKLCRRPCRVSGMRDDEQKDFWALRDLSFEVPEGRIVGVIGRNGAGKSTLLKILSRITAPTTGRARLRGRVASLLEVGTGFHPELTGRENIFLNGTLLGMSKAEVRRKFDAIVDFSGVDEFLDTPVKRYSSGMYVRLAFAVAAHLEPEILLVDEVLAVGDAEFQRRCLARMDEVARGGRTVLFVSHNMSAVEGLCERVILLVDGRIAESGDNVREIITRYLGLDVGDSPIAEWTNPGAQYDNPYFTPLRLCITDSEGRPMAMPMRNDADARLRIEAECRKACPKGDLTVCYSVYDASGLLVYSSCITDMAFEEWPTLRAGRARVETSLPPRLLNEGVYHLKLVVRTLGGTYVCNPANIVPAVRFEIRGGLSESPRWRRRRPGVVAPVLRWALLQD